MPDLPPGTLWGSQRFGDTNVSDGSQSIQGIVNGDVHLPQRPETPPTPAANVPFSQDRDFVRRGKILGQVHQLCAAAASRVALVGLGGVGKSQIAIEYAYQVREQSPETWVFWVHASNAARYEQSFRAIADMVKLPGRQIPQNNIYQLVGSWLQSGKSGSWVIILDNVDNAGFLLETPGASRDGQSSESGNLVGASSSRKSQTPISYLPYCPHGSVLITSRSRDVALRLVEARDIIAVEPMSQVDAIALIEKKLGTLGKPTDVADAEAMAKLLECMPLAIVQATSYICQRVPRCSVQQYLEKFEQSDRKGASLLDFERGQLRRDREAKNSIILTWQISFDHIREIRPSAAGLLSMMCFCDRQGIPESLLRRLNDRSEGEEETMERKESDQEPNHDKSSEQGVHSSEDEISTGDELSGSESSSSSSGDKEFERDILMLRDFAFVAVDEDGTTFEMHGLVQLATRRWLKGQGQDNRWKQEFLRCLCAEVPTGEYEHWTRWQRLLPHATLAVSLRPKGRDSDAPLRDWASILFKMAWYLATMRRVDEGQKVAEAAMQIRIELFGREDEQSLLAVSMVSDYYSLQGKLKDAEELRMEVLESRKMRLGVDHPSTLISMGNLASTYSQQGRWESAEGLWEEVMETRITVLGAGHPDTLVSMAGLARTYHKQGRWEKAEKLEVEVMESRKTQLGVDHPDTLASVDNLASTYFRQGRLVESEELLVELVERSKTKLGVNHPDTVTRMANLALTQLSRSRQATTDSMCQRNSISSEAIWGETNLHTSMDHEANLQVCSRTQPLMFHKASPIRPYLTFTLVSGQIQTLRIITWSRDQGWAAEPSDPADPYADSHTWFAIGLAEETDPECLYEFQRNVRASTDVSCHTNEWHLGIPIQDDEDVDALQGWLESLSDAEGVTLGIFPRARYTGWQNMVLSVTVKVTLRGDHEQTVSTQGSQQETARVDRIRRHSQHVRVIGDEEYEQLNL